MKKAEAPTKVDRPRLPSHQKERLPTQGNIESSSPLNTTRLAAGFSFGVFMLRKTDDKCGPQPDPRDYNLQDDDAQQIRIRLAQAH